MDNLTKRQAAIMALIHANPRGWPSTALAKRIGLTHGRTAEVLRQLRKLGLAEPTVDGGRSSVWSTPERCKVLRQIEASRSQKLKRARAKQRSAAATIAAWLNPVHRRISASEAPPIRPRAPASVFHLAA